MTDNVKCPMCGASTRFRTSKKDGRKFHVCINYPECKGKVAWEDEYEEEDEWEEVRPETTSAYDKTRRRRVPRKNAAHKRKKPSRAVIAIVMVLVIIATAGITYAVVASRNNVDRAALETLDNFLTYAMNDNYNDMWNMLHTDSQNDYLDLSDFESGNFVSPDDTVYVIDDWDIVSSKVIPTWQTYSNVVEIKVDIEKHMDPWLEGGCYLLFGVLCDVMPTEETLTWRSHLVKVGDEWKIFCEREPSSTKPTPTATGTTSTQTGDCTWGCPWSNVGNGHCDWACYCLICDWDGGDCN